MRKGLTASAIIFFVVMLDLITKYLIENYVQPYEVINILPFLNIVNIKNPGAAFGILPDMGNNIFILISFVAIVAVLYLLKKSSAAELVSLSLILGGAIGNLIDRLTIGKVTDFIDFFVGKWHWPAFNVADSALTIGIFLYLWANIRIQK